MSTKPTLEQVSEVVRTFGKLISFFPDDPRALRIIAAEIYSFVGTVDQLQWFALAAVREMGKWDGVPHLREIYCRRFPAADGVPPVSELPGFSGDDQEHVFRMREIEANTRRLEEYKRQAQLMPPADCEPFLLPEAKQLPAVATPKNSLEVAGALKRPLKEREEEMAAALRSAPKRTDEERARIERELRERLEANV